MICNIGTGFTAGSKVFVKKSKRIFGQKKPSRAAAIWSVALLVRKGRHYVLAEALTSASRESDETSPVVLDKSSHFGGCFSLSYSFTRARVDLLL